MNLCLTWLFHRSAFPYVSVFLSLPLCVFLSLCLCFSLSLYNTSYITFVTYSNWFIIWWGHAIVNFFLESCCSSPYNFQRTQQSSMYRLFDRLVGWPGTLSVLPVLWSAWLWEWSDWVNENEETTNTCSENLGPDEMCVLRDVPVAYNLLNYYIQITDEMSLVYTTEWGVSVGDKFQAAALWEKELWLMLSAHTGNIHTWTMGIDRHSPETDQGMVLIFPWVWGTGILILIAILISKLYIGTTLHTPLIFLSALSLFPLKSVFLTEKNRKTVVPCGLHWPFRAL